MDPTKILNLMERIRHNYEGSLLAATYASCSRGCGRRARGGGICPDCATEELGELIGTDLSITYQAACKGVMYAAEAIYTKIREGST
ncbi:hypothetical protein RHDC4_03078 [Rhodocyclaceae bacterium]|nr:hypothetical protein RHDC4_03078 [Rhodocyclaceae bacterium]